MPELPEVQTVVDGLSKVINHQRILKIDILESKTLSQKDSQCLIGQIVNHVYRRGKYIIFEIGDKYLVVHLRMTGQFFYDKDHSRETTIYDRVIFVLTSGRLVFKDVRKFGTMKVGDDLSDLMPHLGVEPLSDDFTNESLQSLCQASKKCIKALLLDQSKIAGLGNIYADEALFESMIDPRSCASKIPFEVLTRLQSAIKLVLKRGLDMKGTSLGKGLGNYQHVNGRGSHQEQLKVYARHKQDCFNCHSLLERHIVASRGTSLCPKCQKLFA